MIRVLLWSRRILFFLSGNQKALRGRDRRFHHPPWSVPVTFSEMDLIAAVAADVFEAGGRCCCFFRWYEPASKTLRPGDNFFRRASKVVDSSSCRRPDRLFFLLSSSCRCSFATCTLRPPLVSQGTGWTVRETTWTKSLSLRSAQRPGLEERTVYGTRCTYTGVPLSKYTVGVLRSNNGVEENQWSTNGRGVEFSSSPR